MDTRYVMTRQTETRAYGELLTAVLAIILPPLAVLVRVGWHPHLLLNTVLTLFGWLPGALHAVWVLGRFPYRLRSGL
ncbi:MAG: YqaE/Pmp3 family membrane protein [Myxococcota bacterium]